MALASAASTSSPTFLFFDTHFSSHPSSSPNLFFYPYSKPKPTILCHSSSSTTTTTSSSQETETPTHNPSLSDQLRPLSLTLLHGSGEPRPLPSTKPKPTWVNPSKPRPSVLSPHRQRRTPFPHNANLTHLSRLARALAATDDLSAALPEPPSRADALALLNSLRPWSKSLQLFRYLKAHSSFPLDTIFYNVAMKSLRSGRQYDLAEQLMREMLDSGPLPDNITYSTLITCAKNCRRYDDAIAWFERMYKSGVLPDEVTYSAVLDVYARLGKREEVISLFERARAGGWTPDPVAFSVLARMFGEAGDYDGIQYVLKEMKSLNVKPNLVVYNTLLEALGKAGKPGLARSLFEEMVAAGVSPNEKTLTALIKIYGKVRWGRDALELWERMKANRWPMDFILYNTLLSMCADLGLEEEAERLFDDMKRPDRHVRPDSWSYTAMINIYASGGKDERAMEMFEDMLDRGVEPNVMGCTCLIQCLGKAKRIGDAVRVFENSMQRGVKPDDRLSGCLLSLVALCEEGELDMVLDVLGKTNPRLVGFVKMLANVEVGFDVIKDELRGILNEAAPEVRRPFCNCLIDICRNQSFPSQRAFELLHLGTIHGLYPGLHTKSSSEWSLNLRSLSVGAANTAFDAWMESLAGSLEHKEVLPEVFSVYTGTGTHKFSQGLAGTFELHLKTLAAPFLRREERSGGFLSTKEDLISWLESRIGSLAVTA